MIDRTFVTTSFDFAGYAIKEYCGVVRGITVRSRSVVGNLGASFQTLVGGKISIYVNLCEQAREEAFTNMLEHASETPANAIIGIRYDANDVAPGITEVICYGTAVRLEKAE